MYTSHFALKEKPFNITANPDYLFKSYLHQQAIRHLEYGIHDKVGLMLLTGPIGSGKTTLCRYLLNELGPTIVTCYLPNPWFKSIDMLRAINQDFGLDNQGSYQEQLERLNKFLLNNARQRLTSLIIVDEAQNLSLDNLEALRLLSNLESKSEKLLQILIVGQKQLEKKMKHRDLQQLNQRIIIRQKLRRLNPLETGAYIQHRLDLAGNAHLFSWKKNIIKLIHRKSDGNPRMINLICDRLLTALYANNCQKIEKKYVKQAYKELAINRAHI